MFAITIPRLDFVSLIIASLVITLSFFLHLFDHTIVDLCIRFIIIIYGNIVILLIGFLHYQRIDYCTRITLKTVIILTIIENLMVYALSYNVFMEYPFGLLIGSLFTIVYAWCIYKHKSTSILKLLDVLYCFEMGLYVAGACYLFQCLYLIGYFNGPMILIFGILVLLFKTILLILVFSLNTNEAFQDQYSLNDDAYQSCLNGNIENLKFLKNNGLKLNEIRCRYNEEKTGLMAACDRGQVDIVKYLLENGCSTSGINMGYILINACINGHLELIKYLVNEKQCSLQTKFFGKSCIIQAAMKSHIECIVWMLNNGSFLDEAFEDWDGNIVNCITILKRNGIYEQVKRIMTQKSSRK